MATIKALVKVGEYEFPEPSSYNAMTSTLVDSARNVQGVMIGSVIRDDVAKIEIGWKYLTVQQWAEILQCFDIASGGKFINKVTFFNQVKGDWDTRDMYVGDRQPGGAWRRHPETGELLGWTDCKISLIEV